MTDGQVVEMKPKGGEEKVIGKGGTPRIGSSSLELVVTCADGSGQTVVATAAPAF